MFGTRCRHEIQPTAKSRMDVTKDAVQIETVNLPYKLLPMTLSRRIAVQYLECVSNNNNKKLVLKPYFHSAY